MGELDLTKVFEASLVDFAYDSFRHRLVAEHSNIDAAAKAAGCDAWASLIDIRSHVTGRVVRYHWMLIDRDRDGEILSWGYDPDEPGLPTMVLLND